MITREFLARFATPPEYQPFVPPGLCSLGLGGGGAGVTASGLAQFGAPIRPQLSLYPALSTALAASTRASLAIVSDSTAAGWGSNGPPSGSGVAGDANNARRARAWPQQLCGLIKLAGVPCRADAFFGHSTTSNTIAEVVADNPNLTLGAGWSVLGTVSVGGRMLENSTDTTALTFTPEENANSFDVLYVQTTGYATFTVTDASGTLATVNAAGSLSVIKATVTRSVASKLPISIQRNGTGTNLRLIGIVPYDTTTPMLEIWNMGWAGSTTTNWTAATNAVSPLNAMIVMPPTAWFIELGPNDANASLAAATYQANLITLTTQAQTVAPVVIGKPHKARSNASPYDIPATYLTAIDAVAVANAVSIVDFNAVTFPTADYFDSSVHQTYTGQHRKAATFNARIAA